MADNIITPTTFGLIFTQETPFVTARIRQHFFGPFDSVGYVGGYYWKGQTFTVETSHLVTTIGIKAYRIGSATVIGDLLAILYNVDENELPTGSYLTYGSIDADNIETGSELSDAKWYYIDVSPYLLSSNTMYALIFYTSELYYNMNYGILLAKHSSGNYYTNGRSFWTDDDGEHIYHGPEGEDYGFAEFSEELISCSPESFGLAITSEVPTTKFGSTISPSTLELASTLETPDVLFDYTIPSDTLELASTLETPDVSFDSTISPSTLELTSTIETPNVFFGRAISVDALELASTLETPDVLFPIQIIKPSIFETILVEEIPNVPADFTFFPDTFELALSELDIFIALVEFPVLSRNPISISFRRIPDPNVIRISANNPVFGKSGRLPKRKEWIVTYNLLTETDKNILQTFEKETVKHGTLPFQWTNVGTKQSYKVKFSEPLKFEAVKGMEVRYNCTMKLVGAGTYGMGKYGAGVYGY